MGTQVTPKRARTRQKHRWLKWLGGVLFAVIVTLTCIVLVLARRAQPLLRARIVQELEDHFHARVELDSFHLTLRNGLWADGKGLRIWPPANVAGVSVPGSLGEGPAAQNKPLISLAEFRFHAPLHYKPGEAIHIRVVQLMGLEIDVPPHPHFDKGPRSEGRAGRKCRLGKQQSRAVPIPD